MLKFISAWISYWWALHKWIDEQIRHNQGNELIAVKEVTEDMSLMLIKEFLYNFNYCQCWFRSHYHCHFFYHNQWSFISWTAVSISRNPNSQPFLLRMASSFVCFSDHYWHWPCQELSTCMILFMRLDLLKLMGLVKKVKLLLLKC